MSISERLREKQQKQPSDRTTKQWIGAGAAVLFLTGMLWLLSNSMTTSSDPDPLSYLRELPEVEWIIYRGNEAFVGFRSPLPEDWQLMTRVAALKGSKARGGRFRAYAVDGSSRNFDPSGRFPYFACAHADGSKVTSFEQ